MDRLRSVSSFPGLHGGKPSRLLALPRELRDEILILCVTENGSQQLFFILEDIVWSKQQDNLDKRSSFWRPRQRFIGPKQPTIARTCHQLRSETLSLFYSENRAYLEVTFATREADAQKCWWMDTPAWVLAAPHLQSLTIWTAVAKGSPKHESQRREGLIVLTAAGPAHFRAEGDVESDKGCCCCRFGRVTDMTRAERAVGKAGFGTLMPMFVGWAVEHVLDGFRRPCSGLGVCRLCGKEGNAWLYSYVNTTLTR